MRKFILIIMLGIASCLSPSTAEAQGFLKKAGEKLKKAKEVVSSAKNMLTEEKSNPESGQSADVLEAIEEVSSDVQLLHPELPQGRLYKRFRDDGTNSQFMPRTSAVTKTVPVKRSSLYYSDFSDGVALIEEYGKAPYFINQQGEKLDIDFDLKAVDSDYNAYPKFYNGRTIIHRNGEWLIVDKAGKVIKTLSGNIVKACGFVDGIGLLIIAPDSFKWQYRYIDTNGNTVYPMLGYTQIQEPALKLGSIIRPTCDGMTAIRKIAPGYKMPGWGFYDSKGNLKIQPKYYKVHDFHNGLAAVQEMKPAGTPGKWGFIDANGNVVVDFLYREPSDFNGDYALVRTGYSEWDMIDKNGHTIGKIADSDDFIPIANGYALYTGSEGGNPVQYLVSGKEKKKLAYTVNGDLRNVTYDPVDGKYYQNVEASNPFGWIEIPSMNTKLMQLKGFFRDGIAKAVDGYVNEDGEYVIKFEYQE